MIAIDQLINNQNVLRVTQYLMDLDTAMIEERYRKMGVRYLVEDLSSSEEREDEQETTETLERKTGVPLTITSNESLQTRAIILAKLLIPEAKERLMAYVKEAQANE